MRQQERVNRTKLKKKRKKKKLAKLTDDFPDEDDKKDRRRWRDLWARKEQQHTSNLLLHNAGISICIPRSRCVQHVASFPQFAIRFRRNPYEILCRDLHQIPPYEFIILAERGISIYFTSCPPVSSMRSTFIMRAGMKRSPLARFATVRKFQASLLVNSVVNMLNWHARYRAPFGNDRARTNGRESFRERFTFDCK